jgi:uncharacterized membrane protein
VLLSITEFIGHLHPVLVHLPIGILLLACLFIWQSRKDKYERLQPAINTILFLGMLSAVLACITGFILSQTGDYDEQLLGLHQWMGISVAAISILTYWLRKRAFPAKWQFPLSGLLLVLIFITGHLGGSLTHGPDYLTQPLRDLSGSGDSIVVRRKFIPDIQQAILYADLVQPVLEGKCYGCHGPRKQKGRLRMDQPGLLMKGGKDGAVIIPGKPDESLLIKRIGLPEEDEHHMAPKEKPQLSEKEIRLLQWWVGQGADFTKKVKDIQQPESIKSILLFFQTDTATRKEIPDIPEKPVEKAGEAALQKLRDRGVVILPVAQNSNWLDANFITAVAVRDADMGLLLPVRKQLTWLKLGGALIDDSALAIIGQCSNLIRLQLDHTAITDKGMDWLKSLSRLQTLNLVGTHISSAGLMKLKDLKELRSLFLFQTAVDKKDWDQLKKAFPRVELDSGGYMVPFLQTDTMIVRPPILKS